MITVPKRTLRSRSFPIPSGPHLRERDAAREADRAFFLACKQGRLEELVRHIKSDPSRLNDYIKAAFHEATPLFWATFYGHHTLVSCLIRKGADINKGRLKDGRPPIVAAASSTSGSNYTEVVRLLLGAGASINKVDKEGQSALLCACSNGRVEMTQLLLQARADPNHQNCFGVRPIFAAFTHQLHTLDLVRLLASFGADMDVIDPGSKATPLSLAQHELPSVYDFLLHHQDQDAPSQPPDEPSGIAGGAAIEGCLEDLPNPPFVLDDKAKRFVDSLRAQLERLAAENERLRGEVESARHEVDRLREDNANLLAGR